MRLSCSRRRPPSLGFFLSPLRRDREHFPGGQRRVKSVTSAGRGPPRLCDPGLALPPSPCLPGRPKNSWLINLVGSGSTEASPQGVGAGKPPACLEGRGGPGRREGRRGTVGRTEAFYFGPAVTRVGGHRLMPVRTRGPAAP